MAILTFSAAPAKDSTVTVSLDKAELYALAPISGNAFWSNPDNIEKITVIYESTVGNQTKVLTFDAQQASPEDSLSFSNRARDNFELNVVVLKDYDSGELRLSRSVIAGLVSMTPLDIDISGSVSTTIGLFHFNNDATDATGNMTAYAGIYMGAGAYGSGLDAKFGQSLYGKGTPEANGAYFAISNTGLGDPLDAGLTIEFFAKINGNHQITPGAVFHAYGYSSTPGSTVYSSLKIDNGSLYSLYTFDNVTPSWELVAAHNDDGLFHHYVIMYDTTMQIANFFIDGVLKLQHFNPAFGQSYKFLSDGQVGSGGTIHVGGAQSGLFGYATEGFLGNIDELRISRGMIYSTAAGIGQLCFTPPSAEF